MTQEYTKFLLRIGDFALENRQPQLRDLVRDLLLLVPSGEGREGGEVCASQWFLPPPKCAWQYWVYYSGAAYVGVREVRGVFCGAAPPPPADHTLVADMLDFCREHTKRGMAEAEKALTNCVIHRSHMRTLYNLEVGREGEWRGRWRRRGDGWMEVV